MDVVQFLLLAAVITVAPHVPKEEAATMSTVCVCAALFIICVFPYVRGVITAMKKDMKK